MTGATMTVKLPVLPEIKMDGPHVSKLRKNYDYDEETKDKIFTNAADMLSHCPGPGYTRCTPFTGIMIGNVQSGKTSNFVGLTALAFDNGYKFVIVLGGTKKNLVSQTFHRLEDYFKDDDIFVLSDIDKSSKSSILDPVLWSDKIKIDRRIVLVTIKNTKALEQIQIALSKTNLYDSPVMIIDDEADEATPNTLIKKGEQSSTYASVLKLINTPNRVSFIPVTATSQAYYLIGNDDAISPDHATLIYPGDGYCGLGTFHGMDQKKYARIISEQDSNDMENLDNGIPHSFLQAFSSFFVGAGIRRYRGDADKHAMLVHTSSSKKAHFDVAKTINSLIDDWNCIAEFCLEGVIDDSYGEIRKLFIESYEDFKNTCPNIPDFESLEPYILKSITNCQKHALICNDTKDDSPLQKNYDVNIFVGGNKLQRGITIHGLSVTYMTRRANNTTNVDTSEQRARWFGYRMKHIDVCRLYITQQISVDYENILDHEEKLWAHISSYLNEGFSFKEIPRVYELVGGKLKPTRTNVASSKRLSVPKWLIQTKALLDNETSKNNRKISDDFFNEILTEKYIRGATTHHIAYNIPFNEVYNKFLTKITMPESDKRFNKQGINLIKQMLANNDIDTNVNVVWMRKNSDQGRTISDNKINQLLSGANTYYLGDRYFVNELKYPSNITLQIHFIKPLGITGEYDPFLAIAIKFSTKCISKVNKDLFIREGDLDEY